MERDYELNHLIARAAVGEPVAAEAILTKLASGNPNEQLATLTALYRATSVGFWQHVLEYLATGRWGGAALCRAVSESGMRKALQPKIRALFLAAPFQEPSGKARHDALLLSIAGENAQISRAAVALAGASGSPHFLSPLLAALADPRDRIRLEAARALGVLGDPRAVPALIETLCHEDELLASLARDALVDIGPQAVESLVQVLDDVGANEQAHWMAARALARIGDARAIPSLVAKLSGSNYGVRWAAADGLIALKGQGLRAVLRALATQPVTPWLADSAAHVLQHAQPHDVKEILKPVLDALRSVDSGWLVPTVANKAASEISSKGLP